MPIFVELPPDAMAEMRSLWGSEEAPAASGVEARHVEAQLDEVACHWFDRCVRLAPTEVPDDEDLDYSLLPLDSAGTATVTYKYIGEIQPLPYEWNE